MNSSRNDYYNIRSSTARVAAAQEWRAFVSLGPGGVRGRQLIEKFPSAGLCLARGLYNYLSDHVSRPVRARTGICISRYIQAI